MPQCWRLACNYAVASKSDGGRRVTKATTSTFRPEVSRRTSAAYRASGKLMSSALTSTDRSNHRQARLELLGLEAAAGAGTPFPGKEPLGSIMAFIIVAMHPPTAVG